MNKLDQIRSTLSTRGKSLLGAYADILETVTRQNLAFASDVAGFAVTQVRLPTQANDLGDYRSRSKEAVSVFGGKLKGHGQNLISELRGVPAQLKDALSGEAAVATPKTVKKAAKKAVAKKAKTVAKKAKTVKKTKAAKK